MKHNWMYLSFVVNTEKESYDEKQLQGSTVYKDQSP